METIDLHRVIHQEVRDKLIRKIESLWNSNRELKIITGNSDKMKEIVKEGLDKKTHILAGVIPIKSAGMARYMRDYVPGVSVPDELVTRMEDAKDAKEEGLKICLEIIEQTKDIPGVHGVHIMAVGWEDMVPTIVERAGLLPRPLM